MQNLINANTVNRIFPSQNNLHTFILNLLLSCPLLPHFPPLTFNLQVQCPSQDMTILPHQHMIIPANTVCHRQMIYSFIQTQHQLLRPISIFDLYSTHSSHHRSLCPLQDSNIAFFQAPLHLHTVLLALHYSYKQPLSALEEIYHTATHRTP